VTRGWQFRFSRMDSVALVGAFIIACTWLWVNFPAVDYDQKTEAPRMEACRRGRLPRTVAGSGPGEGDSGALRFTTFFWRLVWA
jgi:hypothetical protein